MSAREPFGKEIRQCTMQRISFPILLLTFFLGACSLSVSPVDVLPSEEPAQAPTSASAAVVTPAAPTDELLPPLTSEVLPPPKLEATLATPHIDQGPDGAITEAPPESRPQDCGYQWATQDLPDLSAQFLQSSQALQPEAETRVYAFGENCTRADGSATFIPMETDFEVTLQVNDLSNESELGEWVVKVMQVIEAIPEGEIVGPRPGRVSIIMLSNEDRGGVSFYKDQYQALPAGLSNAEIYQTLKTLQ
jgi:hypothetical protein